MDKSSNAQNVLILGASAKPQRYAYKALYLLKQHGHRIIPVHPKLSEIDGIKVFNSLSEVVTPIDTLTLYVGAQRSQGIIEDIVKLNPGRVIFNPGSESELLEQALTNASISYQHDCTLVMLETGSF
jgi:predicted CoA-binding protein